MGRLRLRHGLLGAVALGLCLAAGPLRAADPPLPSNTGPANYAALANLPDWRGIWVPVLGRPSGPPEELQYTPEYQALYEKYRNGASSHGPNQSNCLPPGMPRIMLQPYDLEFLFTPGRVTIIQEAYMQVRRVFTDGRPHPTDPDPTFNGHSIGHWEGDTLVVDTVGLRGDTWLTRPGTPHSDQLHIVERIHLAPDNPDKMILEFTFTDPKALTAPYHEVHTFERHREWDQIEFICDENDRNPIDSNGKTETLLRQ